MMRRKSPPVAIDPTATDEILIACGGHRSTTQCDACTKIIHELNSKLFATPAG
jgi:hypothetical protein